MRILFISQLFDPENSIKGVEFARRLQALGHEVEVATTFPSYPGGKLFSGYRQRWKQVEVLNGIRVVRLPTYVSHGTSAVGRMLSYASFGIMAGIFGLLSGKRYHVVYAYYPPVAVGLAAMLIGRFRRAAYVYDVQDLWPEALIATGNARPGSAVIRWVDWLCRLIYKRASRIVVISEGYKHALIAKGVPEDKIERIFNWCDESRMGSEALPRPDGLTGPYFNILYAGNLGAAQALEHVIEAARVVRQRGNHRIRFVFLGTGSAEHALKALARAHGLQNVTFLPRVPVEAVGAYLMAADALLVHLADEPVFEITIPQKTQAYLMAGRPILMAARGEATRIVRNAGAGLLAEPCQPGQIAQAAIAMSGMGAHELENMGLRGKRFYQREMSMDSGVRSVDALLTSIMAENGWAATR